MNIKPSDKLARTVNCHNPVNNDKIVEILGYAGEEYFLGRKYPSWNTKPQLMNVKGQLVPCPDDQLRPIRDNPGNEQFVTDARNKLKGKTEITERGEVHS